MTNRGLLPEIETFLQRAGMAETYFGQQAVGNCKLVSRLREGKRVWPETEIRIRAWMEANKGYRGRSKARPVEQARAAS